MTGLELIIKERAEQIGKHGYTLESDLKYKHGELKIIAEYLIKGPNDAEADNIREWLTSNNRFTEAFISKLDGKTRIEKLAIAGAFIAAHIDLINNHENIN